MTRGLHHRLQSVFDETFSAELRINVYSNRGKGLKKESCDHHGKKLGAVHCVRRAFKLKESCEDHGSTIIKEGSCAAAPPQSSPLVIDSTGTIGVVSSTRPELGGGNAYN